MRKFDANDNIHTHELLGEVVYQIVKSYGDDDITPIVKRPTTTIKHSNEFIALVLIDKTQGDFTEAFVAIHVGIDERDGVERYYASISVKLETEDNYFAAEILDLACKATVFASLLNGALDGTDWTLEYLEKLARNHYRTE